MNTSKLKNQNGSYFFAGSNNASLKHSNIFSEIVLKNITPLTLKALNFFGRHTTNPLQKESDCVKAELKRLKEEVLLLKKDNQLKDVELNMLKLNLADVKTNMDQFSYIASHDLKEPLRMVTSYLGLLKNKFGSQLDEKANTYIDFAIDGGARLHTMFNSLLDLSQTGRIEEQKRTIPFNEIIAEVKINLSKKIKVTDAHISIVGKMPVLQVYEKSVIKLMENLLCNAMKFSKPGEKVFVEISVKEENTNWEFCIADNGIGIDACYYKQIFAVFSKLHNNILYPGNGIGLAICKKAVEHHGGALWVTSEVNRGSKFYFTLPK